MSILDRINGRRMAYRACFLKGEKLSRNGEIVMAHLAKFCRAQTSTAMVSPVSRTIDPIAMAMGEGRREVFLLFQHYLNMDERTIVQLRDAEMGQNG